MIARNYNDLQGGAAAPCDIDETWRDDAAALRSVSHGLENGGRLGLLFVVQVIPDIKRRLLIARIAAQQIPHRAPQCLGASFEVVLRVRQPEILDPRDRALRNA